MVKWAVISVVVGATAVGLLLIALGTTRDVQTRTATPHDGRAIYLRHCASCHGPNLEGEPNWRRRKPDGRLPAPPHDVTGHTWHHADNVLFKITKFGTEAIVGGDYKSNMPGFGNVMTDDEIRAVLAYIKSTWPASIRQRQEQMNKRQQGVAN